jgi:penicillin-binding protein 1B
MGKTRKKAARRKRKSGSNSRIRWWSRLWRLMLLLGGIFLGLMVPWVAYLNHQVTTEFEGRKWDLPSRVFARALDLYPGAPLSLQDLETELRLAGYRRGESAGRPVSRVRQHHRDSQEIVPFSGRG